MLSFLKTGNHEQEFGILLLRLQPKFGNPKKDQNSDPATGPDRYSIIKTLNSLKVMIAWAVLATLLFKKALIIRQWLILLMLCV